MHNRDMIWHTADGRYIAIKDLTSVHLINIIKHLITNELKFIDMYGTKNFENAKHNIIQEIRMRKLNRIETDNNQEELF
jgi:hypothetical protein